MAVKEFNSNKIKRTFWPFTLKDKTDENGEVIERGKKIVVRMPQKGVFEAIKQIQSNDELPSLPLKEQSLYATEVFQKIAGRRNIKLKFMKKSSNINPPQTAKHK